MMMTTFYNDPSRRRREAVQRLDRRRRRRLDTREFAAHHRERKMGGVESKVPERMRPAPVAAVHAPHRYDDELYSSDEEHPPLPPQRMSRYRRQYHSEEEDMPGPLPRPSSTGGVY